MEAVVPKRACFICDVLDCPHLPGRCDLRLPLPPGSGSGPSRDGLREATADEYDAYFYSPCQRCDTMPPVGSLDGSLCLRCQHLRLQHLFVCIARPDETVNLTCGTYGQVLQGLQEGCQFCTFLYKAPLVMNTAYDYLSQIKKDYKRPGEDKGDKAWVSCYGPDEGGVGWRVKSCWGAGFDIVTHAPEKPSRHLNELGGHIAVAGPHISWDVVKSWLSECISQHQHQVIESTDPTMSLPEGFMVIDVENGCVSDASTGCHYIALSYVWGQLRPGDLTATAANISYLRTPGALTRGTLPATVWDSMTICKRLGLRFCWVDRLCIVQDNESQKIAQIRSMDVIFSRAIVTICAVGSTDSHTGLWGADDTPRSRGQGIARIGDIQLVSGLPDDRKLRLSHAWWTRAWTYQEYLLSNRKLLISPWQVTFECDHNVKYESPNLTREIPEPTPEFKARTGNEAPMQTYLEITQEYNTRILTWDDDIYGAFQGIFKSIYKTLDQFVWCLPAAIFDQALLWNLEALKPRPNDTHGPMYHGIPRFATRPGNHIASWSWASSKGRTVYTPSSVKSSLARYNSWHETTGLQPVITDGLTWEDEAINRLYAWCTWSSGLIETPLPTDLQGLSYASLRDKLQDRWPTYQDYWREAFGAPSGPWICENATKVALLKEKTGRLLVRTTMSSFRLSGNLEKAFVILASDGTAVGGLDWSSLVPDAIATGGKDWDFVALSAKSQRVGLFSEDRPSLGQVCNFKPLPEGQV